MNNLKNIPAIVTGGASGLGLATTKALIHAGAKVAIFDVNNQQGNEIAKKVGCVFCHVDITQDEYVEQGFAKAREANGQERILINCAGGGGSGKTASRSRKTGEIKGHDMSVFEKSIALNLIGTFRCIKSAAAGMMTLDRNDDGERGVIVNTASVAAQDGQIGQAAYSASKAGIVGMTLPIARDLASEAIRVNTVMPGLMETPPLLALPDKILDGLAASVPYPKRLGKPQEFASIVMEIIRNSYLNGQALRLDGAIRMAPR